MSSLLLWALWGGSGTAGGFAEPIQPSPPPAQTSVLALPVSPVTAYRDWTGAYGGLEFGEVEGRALDGPQKLDGSAGGAHLGYRIQTGRLVLGGEMAYDVSDLPVSTSEVESVRRTGLQAGYALGRVLPFLTAGQAVTRTDETNEDSFFYGDLDGFFYGAGMDVAVTESVYMGAQYLAYEFDIEGFEFEAAGVSLRLGMRF